MLISLKEKLAVLAMTKTGSTSVEAALAPYCDIIFTKDPQTKHMNLRRFERFLRPYLKSAGHGRVETCCLFREPVDWLGSWYRYRSRPALKGNPNSTAEISFAAFVHAYLSDEQPDFARVGRQSEFVSDKSGQIGIAHLFAYENFDQYARFLGDRFSRPLDIGTANRSPSGDLYLPPDLRSRLEEALSADFEIHAGL